MLNKEKLKRLCPLLSDIYVCRSTESTNADLAALARSGAKDMTVLCADMQTAGKGRGAHTFYSPDGGLYFSLLLRGGKYAKSVQKITPYAACAVCRALGRGAKIKWVNDIFINERKVCGILTRSEFTAGSASPEWVIVGIGINLKMPTGGFPDEIKNTAGAVFGAGEEYDAEKIVSNIVTLLAEYIASDGESALDFYRQNCFNVKRRVTANGEKLFAKEIDENFNLIAVKENGEEVRISSGEVI